MNLLCPNCGKMLTVPEQYAGQLMKCPLCTGTFTVPALPAGGGLDPAPAFSAPSPPSPDPNPYSLQAPATPDPAFHLSAEPAFSTAPPAPPTPPSSPAPAPNPAVSPAPPRQTTTSEYRNGLTLPANENVLKWVTPAALVLVFLLQFFTWVGVYVGTVPVAEQSAWGAAFGGSLEPDTDLKKFYDGLDLKTENRPGVSLLLLFYMLFFLVTLAAAIAVAALPYINAPLPPPVQQLLPWRWAILAGLNAILLLFLGLQMVVNFGLETSVKDWVAKNPSLSLEEAKEKKDKNIRMADRSMLISMVKRTWYLRTAFLLHILATLAAALVFWLDRRGPNEPPPAIELRW